MKNANALLKRALLLAAIGALSMMNIAYAHGGGGKGTGGSNGGGSASSGSSSSNGHSATASGHTATGSKGSRFANHDPASQSANPTNQHIRVYRVFQQTPSTGYTTQYRDINNEDWRRKHNRVFLGFIHY
ncbi:MAG: hypothetical protein JO170_05720 [Verrucomicrobia bacterium]|nr:hypothetical protein [Verrucomicrobiota bacterium]